ncbi:YcaO-like family protein [Saccharopolyspora sp. NFXS83]|uniref:YcaO-like family protein n=1 Tax=Saccharopolyspora sp. NFXS83 TaxID=2993560 RepID=UPI00224A8AF5|nr:YcaO-like family protein [Saccharopolyspora sp. NFXS83]MCX2729186.1 YcaO-like family protein [Saccharopolyspora sp. NFXS83]
MTDRVDHDLVTAALLSAPTGDDIPPERETPLSRALAAVGEWLTAERLTPDIWKYGPDHAPTYEVHLKGEDGALRSRSSGKGLGERSMASALFESAEHYHLDWRRDQTAGGPEFRTGAELAAQPTSRRSALMRRLGGIMPDARVLAREYRAVDDVVGEPAGAGAVHFQPVFLRDGGYQNWPHPDDDGSFRPLWHYTSSAGYAAGTTLPEALVHAVNELIERDAWSCQLARSYFGTGRGGPELRVVAQESLPPDLGELAESVAELSGSPILIVSITCDTDVPAYVVCDATSDEAIRQIGSGASPVRTYALQRALLEYLQVRTMFKHGPVDQAREAEQIGTALARFPRHLAAARFDVRSLPHERHSFEPAEDVIEAPEELLRQLVGRLREVGVQAYFRVLTRPDGPITVVDVVAPGLEMLDKARAGYPVLPTGRLSDAPHGRGGGRA